MHRNFSSVKSRLLTDGDNDGSNTAITMAQTNYQRQKKWREKNRAIYNLRRRNARKLPESQLDELGRGGVAPDRLPDKPAQPSKIDELREMVKIVSAEPVAPAPKLLVYRDDYGRVISETQWNALQKRKQQATAGGYVLDEYSQ